MGEVEQGLRKLRKAIERWGTGDVVSAAFIVLSGDVLRGALLRLERFRHLVALKQFANTANVAQALKRCDEAIDAAKERGE